MPRRIKTITIVLTGLLMAIVFLLTFFTKIPGLIPQGYVNLGDSAVIVAGVILGPVWGFLAGAVGSAASDIALGFTIYAPITFLVKGFEAVIASIVYRVIMRKMASNNIGSNSRGFVAHLTASICGGITMFTGYFLAEWFILPILDKGFGIAVAVTDLPANIIQGAVGATIAILLLQGLSRTRLWKSIF